MVRDLYPLSVLGVGIFAHRPVSIFMNLATARSAIRARENWSAKSLWGRVGSILWGNFLCESVLFYRGCSARGLFGLTVLLLPPIFQV